jgi:ATP-dependent RNA helicase DDX54/DBP10
MARTGSGKTLAYLIPLIIRLKGQHSSSGPRCLILCPTRELALQILKVGKDLGRGKGKGKGQEHESLRWAVIIGGTGLDEQFEAMASGPDVLVVAAHHGS